MKRKEGGRRREEEEDRGDEPPSRQSKSITTEQLFVSSYLSQLPLDPGQKVTFVPGPKEQGGQGPFVPGGATNRDKRPPFCPGWWLHPGQKVQPFLSWLVTPTRTKG